MKIERPIKEYINENTELTREEICNTNNTVRSILRAESYTEACELAKPLSEMNLGTALKIGTGAYIVYKIIKALVKNIKDRYRLVIHKIYGQSKELNDIYVKVNDLLKNDKNVRNAHKNDLIDASVHYAVLQNTKNGKAYQIQFDQLFFDPDAIVSYIRQIATYCDKHGDMNLKDMEASLMREIHNVFEQYHWYIKETEPMIKVTHYNRVYLDDAIKVSKQWVENVYGYTAYANKVTEYQTQYMQVIELGYSTMLKTYGNNKEYKEMIDRVFGTILGYMNDSIEFNFGIIETMSKVAELYLEQFNNIYDYLKQYKVNESAGMNERNLNDREIAKISKAMDNICRKVYTVAKKQKGVNGDWKTFVENQPECPQIHSVNSDTDKDIFQLSISNKNMANGTKFQDALIKELNNTDELGDYYFSKKGSGITVEKV